MELYLLLGFTVGVLFTLLVETFGFIFILRWAMKQQEKKTSNLVASLAAASKGIQG